MGWIVETDLAAYAARVLPWLERDPVTNTVQATVLTARVDGTVDPGNPWLAWLSDGGAVAGVALRTPPRGLLISPLPVSPLPVSPPPVSPPPVAAATLAAVAEPALPGAAGPPDEVATFARAYAARTGAAAAVRMRKRLYRLDAVEPPRPPPGRLREATPADRDLTADWLAAFGAELGEPQHADPQEESRAIAQRRLWLWEVDGEPVALVGHQRPVVGVPRVGPVYTPPEHRRRGYAAAATAAVCTRLLGRGAATVVLYADLANPTSTGVYRRIGFRPVADHDDWSLEY